MTPFEELVRRTRSVRRFRQRPLDRSEILDLVAIARYAPTGNNGQPLRFRLVYTPDECAKVFACLGWARAIPDWGGPDEGERPTGYVVICGDAEVCKEVAGWDFGIAGYAIALGARERGLGACLIATIDKPKLVLALGLPERHPPLLVVALGEPLEEVVVDDARLGDDLRYFRDDRQVHHVPKLVTEDLVIP